MKILIADDDPVSRRLLEATLVRLNHQVVSVSNGTDAIAALVAPDGPRMAVLDWMMPGADGLAVCSAVRQRTAPYVYLILLTARDRHEDLVAGLDAEADDFLTKPLDIVELRARLRSGERVLDLQEGLLAAQEALRRRATHDDLTGLWNRGMILDRLSIELGRARRDKTAVGLAMADLDYFKLINDTHGHAAGDAVLRHAAQRMRATLRAHDCLGRYGGEEFLLVLPDCPAAALLAAAERSREAVANTEVAFGPSTIPVTVSVGISSTQLVGYDQVALMRAADAALYQAKAHGRNRVAA